MGKLRSGTDQSVWETDLYASSPPLANIAADRRSVNCFSPDVQFLDHSILNGNGATWAWSFPGGSPSSSSDRDPLVSYTTPGSYDVSLTVTDANGTHMRGTTTGVIRFGQFTQRTFSIFAIWNPIVGRQVSSSMISMAHHPKTTFLSIGMKVITLNSRSVNGL